MRKLSTTLMALVILMVPVTALAQQQYSDSETDIQFGLKAGWAWPLSDGLGDTVENNWLLGADVIYYFDEYFGVGLDGRFTKEEFDETFSSMDTMLDWTTVPISFNFYYRSTSDSEEGLFYAGAGLSAIYTSLDVMIDDLELNVEESEWSFGFDVIAGFQYDMFYVEGSFVYGASEFPDFTDVFGPDDVWFGADDDIAVNTGNFSLMGGVRF